MSSFSVLLASKWHPKSITKIDRVSDIEKVAPETPKVHIWSSRTPQIINFALILQWFLENHVFRSELPLGTIFDPKSYQKGLEMTPK